MLIVMGFWATDPSRVSNDRSLMPEGRQQPDRT
jgi:hypothetical protein